MYDRHQHEGLILCLKSVFYQNDINKTLSTQPTTGGNSRPSITEEHLKHLLRKASPADLRYTLDQLAAYARIFDEVWCHSTKDSSLMYSDEASVFNSLLHFVDGTLMTIDNEKVVCKWESLLRWHNVASELSEDLLVCAYLASNDLANTKGGPRRNFCWNPYISTDDATLNAMMELPLADIHAHLKGSSLNFDINWICLMNHITDRETAFKKIEKFRQGKQTYDGKSSLHGKALYAAATRLYLFQQLRGKSYITEDGFNKIVDTNSKLEIFERCQSLSFWIAVARNESKQYKSEEFGVGESFDYAILEGLTMPRDLEEECAYSLLSGERFIMYGILHGIYRGDYKDTDTEQRFYNYLLIKNELRHEINQLNASVGFDNFSIYEERKLIFTKSSIKPNPYQIYKEAAIHLAVASFFASNAARRYHETRITPDLTVEEMKDSILECDKAIKNPLFRTAAVTDEWKYSYILHFIKYQEKAEERISEYHPHHERLRTTVKEQAKAIAEFRNGLDMIGSCYYSDRVVGIDAANSEIACRPEVFAQAFRYLRHHKIENGFHTPNDLGVTYHVGEDFMDVVDGLRAVDEAILYLNMRKGDRIGHGLVLGVDVTEYYKMRNYTIAMSLQMQMDNAAWLYYKLQPYNCFADVREDMRKRFDDCFRRVCPNYSRPINISLYYNSMLLRGDNPECYDHNGRVLWKKDSVDEWNRKALNDDMLCKKARMMPDACRLYHEYHYDKDFKTGSAVYDEWTVSEKMMLAISQVKKDMLKKVADLGLAIECNPTSNYKIGEIDGYYKHPIRKFFNIGVQDNHRMAISSSINTDDKGVFATSIEREYALIAHAMIRYYRSQHDGVTDLDVYNWLDSVRRNSIAQRFDKTELMPEPPSRKTLGDLRAEILKKEIEPLKSKPLKERLKIGLKYILGGCSDDKE